MCMDFWINNLAGACLGKVSGSSPFSNDSSLWDTFDILVGLDYVFGQPTDEDVIAWLHYQYGQLSDRCWVYAAQNVSLRDSLTEKLLCLGLKRTYSYINYLIIIKKFL
jgi:hypothetical protein